VYIPEHFAMDRTEALELVERHSFATVVSAGEAGLQATHVPVLLDRDGHRLLSHFARQNPHWRAFDGMNETLVIFHGPHAYISPSWYPPGFAVPTWNYAVVHIYGRARIIDDSSEVLALLERTVDIYEGERQPAWELHSQPSERVEGLAKGVVAFEVPIERIEGKVKAGQNRPSAQTGVIDALERSADPGERDVARLIERYGRG
jgi:transcriptional regulator